jgi:hypothetical protein
MNKQFTILILLFASFALSACAEEQVAQKASVNLQSAADVKSAAASHTAPAKAATTGQTPDPAKAAKTPSANAKGASAKDAVPPVPVSAKTPAAPPDGAAKVPPAPGKGEAKTPPPGKADPKATGAPAKSVKVEDPPPALSVPAGFDYKPSGRRDPFTNPIPKPVVGSTGEEIAPVIRPDGLPGVLVSEVRLSGIIHSSDHTMNKAMLVVGRNTYFAKKGDSLFDGVIKEIRLNEVVFGMVSAKTRKPVNRDTVVRTGASGGTSAGEKK